MQNEITLDYLVKKKMLGWICNNENYPGERNTICYVYPEYVLEDDTKWISIPRELFPENGAVEVFMSAREDSTEFINKNGQLVYIKFNIQPRINTKENAQNRYTLQYNSNYGSNFQIDIRPISNTAFYQILNYDNEINLQKRELEITNIGNPYTDSIMVSCDEGIYGPFLVNVAGDSLQLKASDKTKYEIGKFPNENLERITIDIRDNHENIKVRLVPTDTYLIEDAIETADWLDDEKLLYIVGKLFKASEKNNFTKNEIKTIKDSLLDQEIAEIEGLNSERRKRVETMLETFSDNEAFCDVIVDRAISDESVLRKIIEKIVTEYYSLIENKIMEHTEVSKRKDLIRQEINGLEEEKRKLELGNREILSQKRKEIEDEIQPLERKRDELKQEKETIIREIQNANEVNDLAKRLDELKEEYNHQIIRNEEKRKDADQIKKQLDNAIQRFRNDIHVVEESIDKELLNRIYNIVNDRVEQKDFVELQPIETNCEFSADEMIEKIFYYINEHENRKITKNEVVNIIICIVQGFITTFAGEPGTGKTSLCNIMGRALGLYRYEEKRMIEISVERGWTSYKDYIGYYNPLTHTLEKSNVEVFDSMHRANAEFGEMEFPFMLYLLDEANLSQIEYYWSVFLRICDAHNVSSRKINLGGNITWRIPNHLKFLATVNFDHTTEELSPRFLDRSWVIMLQPERFDIVEPEDDNYYQTIVPYSYQVVQGYFSSQKEDTINEACENKWTDIKAICKKHNYELMPRTVKMIEGYMKTASKYMDINSAETRLAPLDFALSQKVLPMLSGMIDALITDLLDECEKAKMPLCESHLRRMKEDARENMGYYQFFSHKMGG